MSGSSLKSPTALPDPPSTQLARSANTCDAPPSNGNNLLLPASSWKADGEEDLPISIKSHPNFISHIPLPKIPPPRLSYCFCGCCSDGRSCGTAGWVGDGGQGISRAGFLSAESCSSQHLCKPTQGICRNQVIWH